MKKLSRTIVLVSAIALTLAIPAFAQTEYDLPDGMGTDYINYGTYNNEFFDLMIQFPFVNPPQPCSSTYVNGVFHFTQNDPAATFGRISFNCFYITDTATVTETLDNVNCNPFTHQLSTCTASYSGTYTGTLTFNIEPKVHPHCSRYCGYWAFETVNAVPSNLTF